MSKADKSALEALHAALADKFTDLIQEIDVETKGGAAMLNVMRQFLKDNGIDSVAADGSPLGKLADEMTRYPFDPSQEGTQH